jgi:hypothetical protein
MATKPPPTPNLPKTEAVCDPVPRTVASSSPSTPSSFGDHAELVVGQSLELAGRRLHVNAVVSAVMQTGQAAVYSVSDAEWRTFALKVYAHEADHRRWPYGEALQRLQRLSTPHVMKLHAFGLGADGLDGRYCYELCEYIEGESLGTVAANGTVDAQWVRKVVVPQLTAAVAALQSKDLVHCDLKPENVLLRGDDRQELVIVDVGSSKCLDNANHESVTSMVLGTQVYGSPELAHRVISDKVDTYGIGATVLALFRPDLFVGDGYKQFRLQQDRRLPVVDLGDGLEDLTNLVNGLLVSDRELRWGLPELKRWIQGEKVEVRYRVAEASMRPIRLEARAITTAAELVEFLLEHSEAAWAWLSEAGELPHSLKTWIVDTEGDKACNDLNRVVKRAIAGNEETFGPQIVARYYEPFLPLVANGRRISLGSGEVEEGLRALVEVTDDLWVQQRRERSFDQIFLSVRQPWSLAEFSVRRAAQRGLLTRAELAFVAVVDKLLAVNHPGGLATPWADAFTPERLLSLVWAAKPERGLMSRRKRLTAPNSVLSWVCVRGGPGRFPNGELELTAFLHAHGVAVPSSGSLDWRSLVWQAGATALYVGEIAVETLPQFLGLDLSLLESALDGPDFDAWAAQVLGLRDDERISVRREVFARAVAPLLARAAEVLAALPEDLRATAAAGAPDANRRIRDAAFATPRTASSGITPGPTCGRPGATRSVNSRATCSRWCLPYTAKQHAMPRR